MNTPSQPVTRPSTCRFRHSPFAPASVRHCRLALCLLLSLVALPALSQLHPADHAPHPGYDKRSAAAVKPADAARRQRGLDHAKALLDSTAVDFDPLLGTPKFIHSKDGFLSGPGGQG